MNIWKRKGVKVMLAIGIYYENGFSASLLAPSVDPQKCADALAIHNDNGIPDEILLIERDEVVGHWTFGHEYADTPITDEIKKG